jgi:WD40 repeat protein
MNSISGLGIGSPNIHTSTAGQGNADTTARVWDAKTGEEITVLSGHALGVFSARFSPNGKRILTGSADTTARLWDAKTGREITVLGKEAKVLAKDSKWCGTPSLAQMVDTS